MRLVELQCPNCGAQLQANDELQRCTCNFCGHTFLIDNESINMNMQIQDPRQLGRELEYGRREATGGNQELIKAMWELKGAISEISPLVDSQSRLERDINAHKKILGFHDSVLGNFCRGCFLYRHVYLFCCWS